MKRFLRMAFLGVLVTGCAERLQPQTLLYIEGNASEEHLRKVSREVAITYGMKFQEYQRRPGEMVQTLFGATRNNWLYQQGVWRGNDAEFEVTAINGDIRIMIIAPPRHEGGRAGGI